MFPQKQHFTSLHPAENERKQGTKGDEVGVLHPPPQSLLRFEYNMAVLLGGMELRRALLHHFRITTSAYKYRRKEFWKYNLLTPFRNTAGVLH